jgi:hypothetical protein
MSDEGTRVVPIPGGEKLLSNVEKTGKLLIDDMALIEQHDVFSKDDLRAILEGHRNLGQAMLDAVERTRKKMGGS